MKKNLKISIITVALNSSKTIKNTLESIKSQNYKNIEYIVIDGESKDSTVDIIKSYKNQIAYFISEKDNGIYDAMNKGIKAATGDIIGILNSDDFYASNTIISEIADTFNEQQVDSIYGNLVYLESTNQNKVVRFWSTGNFSIIKLKRGWALPHPTLFVRKAIYDKYGLYNTRLKSAADYEMILRLLYKNNISFHYIDKILVKMRSGGQSNANLLNRIIANREDVMAWRINNLSPPLFIRFTKPLMKIRQFFNQPKY